jgi:hypothetical protein
LDLKGIVFYEINVGKDNILRQYIHKNSTLGILPSCNKIMLDKLLDVWAQVGEEYEG